ncbi:MAG: ShlB/FhaC/HecB family hemolysin secretion/activation protein [Aquisalimonadaceae bacterium]
MAHPVPIRYLAGSLLSAVLAAGTVQAQVVDSPRINPGAALERQLEELERLERERETTPDDQPAIEGVEPDREGNLPDDDTPRLQLGDIRYNESAFISADELWDITDEYLGRPVSFADLNQMLARINAIYASRGIITARAVIPAQRIEGGILEIRLVEGRLGKLVVEENHYTRADYLTRGLPLEAGEVVDLPALRDAINYFNRVNDVNMRANLARGEGFGETDVIIRAAEPPRIQGQVFADNNGAESTGEGQGGIYGIWNGPFGRDDRLTLFAIGSEGTRNAFMSYRLPINRSGGRLTIAGAYNRLEIIESGFAGLDITGGSSEISLAYDQPFLRADTWWLDGYTRLSRSESETEIDDAFALSDNTVDRLSLGGRVRGFGEHTQWSLRQGVTGGQVAENIFGDDTSFWALDGDVSLSAFLPHRLIARFRGGWQYTDDEDLPSSAQFQVGGVSTVRGYPVSAVSGGRGVYGNLELHWQARPGLVPFTFADAGYVDGVSPGNESISSIGLGLNWRHRAFGAELVLAHTLDDVLPDQDENRLHARISYDFAL